MGLSAAILPWASHSAPFMLLPLWHALCVVSFRMRSPSLLSGEQDSCERVSFLDTWVAFDGRCWYTKTYDKREHPPLSRVASLKYPHPSCFISNRAKFGIITSRLHAFSRVCVRRRDFVTRVRMFLQEFQGRGYSRARVWSYVRRFVRTVPLPFPVTSPDALVRELMA